MSYTIDTSGNALSRNVETKFDDVVLPLRNRSMMSLWDTLKEYRSQKSTEKGIPSYCIFTNASIQTLCDNPPQTLQDLLNLKGFGIRRVEEYGEDILNLCMGEDIGTPLLEEKLILEQGTKRKTMERQGTPVNLPVNLTVNLSANQQKVLECIDQGENVFMTGPGGTGKTFLIQTLVQRYAGVKNVQVCALTGAAAELLGCRARTIHSWAGVGVSRKSQEEIIDTTVSFVKNLKPWRHADLLIVDEVSMMSQKLFDILDAVGRIARNPNQPFGGLQLLFSGDFYQLPPVPDKGDIDSGNFCFESSAWSSTFSQVIVLQQNFRQSDPLWMKILRQVRRGGISEKTYGHLKDRVIQNIGHQSPENSGRKDMRMNPPVLHSKRHAVKRENDRNMERLDTEVYTYRSAFVDEISDKISISDKYLAYAKGQLMNLVNAEDILHLKKGAQVMCIANISMDGQQQIVNGSQGVVAGFTETRLPLVAFKNGLVVPLGPHTWPSEDLKGLSLTQIPLILSWAITIHKSQGITLEEAIIDAGPDVFECGQTYVALSRVKTLEGISLIDLDPRSIRANTKVQAYYASL